MALVIASCGLTACGDDNEDENISFSASAEKEAQGTFNGTFVRVQASNGTTVTGTGTFVLTATETANRAELTFTSDELTELAGIEPIPVNISHASRDFVFFNKSSDYSLRGRIYDGKTVKLSFSKLVRISARSSVTYNYSFEGAKQP